MSFVLFVLGSLWQKNITGLSKLMRVFNRDLGRINHLKKYGESESSIKVRYDRAPCVIDGCDTYRKDTLWRSVFVKNIWWRADSSARFSRNQGYFSRFWGLLPLKKLRKNKSVNKKIAEKLINKRTKYQRLSARKKNRYE